MTLTIHLPVRANDTHAATITVREQVGQTFLEIMSKAGYNPGTSFAHHPGAVVYEHTVLWHRQLTLFHQDMQLNHAAQVVPRGPVHHKGTLSLPGKLADLLHPGPAILRQAGRDFSTVRALQPGDDLDRLLGPNYFAIIGNNCTVYSNAFNSRTDRLIPRIASGARLFLTQGPNLLHPSSTVREGWGWQGTYFYLVQLQEGQLPLDVWLEQDFWPVFPELPLHRAVLPGNVRQWRREAISQQAQA